MGQPNTRYIPFNPHINSDDVLTSKFLIWATGLIHSSSCDSMDICYDTNVLYIIVYTT